jgi:hypothetical protein
VRPFCRWVSPLAIRNRVLPTLLRCNVILASSTIIHTKPLTRALSFVDADSGRPVEVRVTSDIDGLALRSADIRIRQSARRRR